MKKRLKAFYAFFNEIHRRILSLLSESARPEMFDSIFGVKSSTPPPANARQPTTNEKYWLKWFEEFGEINSSIQRLNEAAVYLSHYPGTRALRFHGISEADWIRYHIEMHLQEEYIFLERLRKFLTRVEREIRRRGDNAGANVARRVRNAVNEVFGRIEKARGRHVHRARFDANDLKDLDTLILVTKSGKAKQWIPLRKAKRIQVSAKWRRQLSESNRSLQELASLVFEKISPVISRNEPEVPTAAVANGGGSLH